ncbi:aryl-alcohol dehydrogenase (NADP+) [Actinoallomurus bryophytorum]|uniref:Aryl-alcohol dehydrogenase (NADP+) n=2 Tax=Actinoallomurus bryophytorum TaxID=1490222 RepID=A0A543CWK3_9ACTN|nr:aryl-alcohol dehydrogenase (NADP+) [Actinoallomurus bryophytorum]
MTMTKIADTDLDVFPLCLGGNVFGWTADEEASFAVLDAYAGAGGNFIDTADIYAGGESEKILGRWLARRGRRDDIVIATKVGMGAPPDRGNLKAETIRSAVEGSLRSLAVDHIDLYYAHRDDLGTPIEETLAAFDDLVREGKVRHIAASNYEAPRLAAALKISDTEGLARYVALQPHYNLVDRGGFEGDLADLCARENIGVMPYFGLARGFLTGKYRPGGPEGDSPRAKRAREHLDERGIAVLGVLDEVAAAHDTSVASVALAWLLARPTVVAPIASARDTGQLADLLALADLRLTADEVDRLTSASA